MGLAFRNAFFSFSHVLSHHLKPLPGGDRLKTLSTILRLSKPYAKSASICNVVTLVSLIQNDLLLVDKIKHG